jgi:hypothetical protein
MTKTFRRSEKNSSVRGQKVARKNCSTKRLEEKRFEKAA